LRPARIAYLLTAFPTITETFVEGEFRGLMARGFHIDLYATRNFRQVAGIQPGEPDRGLIVRRLPYFWGRETWAGVAFWLLHRPLRTCAVLLRTLAANSGSPRYLLQLLALLPKTLAFARSMKARDTVHVHGTWGHYPATCAFVASRLLDIPFSFSAHAGLDVASDPTFLAAKIRAATFVLACNEANRGVLCEMDPPSASKIHTVYHGVTLSSLPPPGSEPRADPPEILSVGRLAPEKGFEDLLDACGRLLHKGIRFRLRIFGEGPDRSRLERKIRRLGMEETAILEGVAPHPAMLEAAARATVAVLASFEGPDRYLDGIANVLVEAMACATPVISTSYPGSRELLGEGRFGVLVPQRSPESLAEALEELLRTPDRREELAEMGRRRVLADFDRERNLERIAALFRVSTDGAARQS
jgi:glycosyltransferase involved in cell wall biosynthesis